MMTLVRGTCSTDWPDAHMALCRGSTFRFVLLFISQIFMSFSMWCTKHDAPQSG